MEYLTNEFCVGLITITNIFWLIHEVTNGINNQGIEPEEPLPKITEEYLQPETSGTGCGIRI